MLRMMAKAKIHNATVTDTDLYYAGSIGIDREIMEAVDLLPDEWVVVVNINNGARFETYVIAEPAGSKIIRLYGPCAPMDEEEARGSQMKVAILGENNTIEESQ